MKATGIVRKIDELGRIVIPKEIRRTLKIKEGDPLEIFTNRDGELIFKKYSPLNELGGVGASCCKALNETTGYISIVFDKDTILCQYGDTRDTFTGRQIADKLENVIEAKQEVMLSTMTASESVPIKVDDGVDDYVAQIICPILSGESVVGGVALVSQKPGVEFSDFELSMCRMTALVLSKYAE